MKCNEIRELLPDLAAGLATAEAEVNLHLRSCTGCAGTLEEFRKTMALLDEWQSPEPSPYFYTRLHARLREEAAQPNHRNGSSPKTVLTDDGAVALAIPRDRAGTFAPALIPKHQRRLPRFDENVLSLYARGISVRDIQAHLEELYQLDISPASSD